MNWVRNNRFLAAYLTVLLIALGVLGYLLYSAYGDYSQVSQDYQTQVTELKRLQNLTPYPDAQNLQRYSQVKQNYSVAVADLQKQLASREPAPENAPPTPLQFQDRLRRVVDEIDKAALQAGVGLPENFYLGFEQYRGAPPDSAATQGLSSELDAIHDLISILIKQHVTTIGAVRRAPLPHEAGNTSVATAETGIRPPGRPVAVASTTGLELITRNPVELEFTALPTAFRESVNQITNAPRLYVIAALQVKNEVDKGPPRGGEQIVNSAPVFGRGGPPPPPGFPPGPPPVDQNGVPVQPLPEKGPPPLRYVVGLEKVVVAARIDLVKVAPPR